MKCRSLLNRCAIGQRDEMLKFTYRCAIGQRDEMLKFTYRCAIGQRDEMLKFTKPLCNRTEG